MFWSNYGLENLQTCQPLNICWTFWMDKDIEIHTNLTGKQPSQSRHRQPQHLDVTRCKYWTDSLFYSTSSLLIITSSIVHVWLFHDVHSVVNTSSNFCVYIFVQDALNGTGTSVYDGMTREQSQQKVT